MSIKTAIVPVAGLGTRLLPLSQAVPKELLPLGNLPALHLIANELGRAGVERVILVSSQAKQQIQNYFVANLELEQNLRVAGKTELLESLWSHSKHRGLQFETVIQHEQRGLGHAVLCASECVKDEPVIIALGDCVMGVGGNSTILRTLSEVYQRQAADVTIAFEEVPADKVHRFGIAALAAPPKNGMFPLQDVVEKPSCDEAPSRYAIAARYVLGPQIFDELRRTPPGKNSEIQLTDAIRSMIRQNQSAYGVVMREPRFDMGNIHSYVSAFVRFALAEPQLRGDVLSALEGDANE